MRIEGRYWSRWSNLPLLHTHCSAGVFLVLPPLAHTVVSWRACACVTLWLAQSVRAWLHAGAVALQLRCYPDALVCFDRCLGLSKTCAPALLNRAICYHRMGNADWAEKDYSAVIAANGTPVAHRNRGSLRLSRGNFSGGA